MSFARGPVSSDDSPSVRLFLEFHLSTVAPAVRLAARMSDVLLLVAVEVGLGTLMGFGFDWLLLGTVGVFACFCLFDLGVGATPGKLALRLRVTGPDGGRPSPRQAMIRESFTVLGSIPFIGPLLALAAWTVILLTIRSSPLRQGEHDVLEGGTRVLRTRAL